MSDTLTPGRFVVALLLGGLVLSSGCANPIRVEPNRGEAPHSTVSIQDEDERVIVNVTAETGAIVGRVQDDAGFLIPSAHASLIGTDATATTNASGWFQLIDLRPSTYHLRIDHSEYRAAESNVTVAAGNATKVRVTLVPLIDAGAGYRPHIHDQWAGRSEIPVIDSDFAWTEAPESAPPGSTWRSTFDVYRQAAFLACLSDKRQMASGNLRIFFDKPDQLVWAGTGEIRFTLTWNAPADYYGDELSLAWRPPGEANFSATPLLGNGATHSIPVQPAMWDSSHQRWTLWDFFLCRSEYPRPPTHPQPTVVMGKIHVSMQILRGTEEIPFEEPHPRFWQESLRLLVINQSKPARTNDFEPSHDTSKPWFDFMPEAGTIVPPGTEQLEVRFTWSYSLPLNNPPLGLLYRSADLNPLKVTVEDFHEPEPSGRGENWRTYAIAVAPGQTDAFYQKSSTWLFFWGIEGRERERELIGPCVNPCTLALSLEVIAARSNAEG